MKQDSVNKRGPCSERRKGAKMLKTKKSVAKRIRWTAKGKIKRTRAYKGHLLTKKSRKRKRGLRKLALTNKADYKRVRRLLPYGKS